MVKLAIEIKNKYHLRLGGAIEISRIVQNAVA